MRPPARSRLSPWLLLPLCAGGCRGGREPGPAGKTLPGGAEIEAVFVGDMMPTRGVEAAARRAAGARWADHMFAPIAPTLRAADLAFGNLECAVTRRGAPVPKDYQMRADPEAAAALARAGFDVLSLANNHLGDFGADGSADTVREVERHGMVAVGTRLQARKHQDAAIVKVGQVRLAFLAYTQWFPASFKGNYPEPFPFNEKAMAADVARAARRADHVIVSLHGGREYSLRPTREQRAAAERAFAAGATLVVQHHTHTPQPAEIDLARGRAVAFGLGNFLFDLKLPWKVYRVQRALLLRARLSAGRLISAGLEPLGIDRDFRPTPGGDLDVASLTTPWRPAGDLAWNLSDALATARVRRPLRGAARACDDWEPRSEKDEAAMEGFWRCGKQQRDAVGRAADLSRGVYRTTVRAEPRPDSPVTIEVPDVPPGAALAGFAGLSDWSAQEPDASAVRVELLLDGRSAGVVEVPNAAGWREFSLPTPGRAAPATLELRLSAERGARRHLGLDVWVVR